MILTLEQQVCSLQSAKRLKELGFPQESLFYWVYVEPYKTELSYGRLIVGEGRPDAIEICEHASAYTVAELGELLPQGYGTCKYEPTIKKWCAWNVDGPKIDKNSRYIEDNNEAEARAKMLIYLADNQLIELKGREGKE